MFNRMFRAINPFSRSPSSAPISSTTFSNNDELDEKGHAEITIHDRLNDVNEQSRKGKSALHKAVASHNKALVTALLASPNISIDIEDKEGNTPLHLASQQPTADIAEVFINAKTDVRNLHGETPLHLAVAANSLKNVQFLLNTKKSNPNLITSRSGISSMLKSSYSEGFVKSPFHYAFKNKKLSVDIVREFLTANGDVNLANNIGETPFYLAISHPLVDTLGDSLDTFLVKANTGNKTKAGESILHAIAKNKAMSLENFKKVLTKYVSDNNSIDVLNGRNDSTGDSVLYHVVDGQDRAKINLFLSYKPNPNTGARSPLLKAAQNNDIETVKQLLNLDADANAQAINGKTALVYAAQYGNIEMIEALKQHDADFLGKAGEMAIEQALLNNHIDAVIKLIELGANPDVHVKLSEDFEASSSSFSLASISSISSSSRKVDDKTGYLTEGDTPLHYAVKTGHTKLATVCLDAESNLVNSRNAKGRTPVHFAIKVLDPNMAKLLRDKGEFSLTHPNPNGKNPCETTFLMQAATRGFTSQEDLEKFFTGDYVLSDTQMKIKERVMEKYHRKQSIVTSVPSVKAVGKFKVRNAPADEAHIELNEAATLSLSVLR